MGPATEFPALPRRCVEAAEEPRTTLGLPCERDAENTRWEINRVDAWLCHRGHRRTAAAS